MNTVNATTVTAAAATFDGFLARAWDAHADQPRAVADSLRPEGLPLVRTAEHVAALATLVQHLWGEHLGDWQRGLADLQCLQAHPACSGGGQQALRRCTAALALCAGDTGGLLAATPSDRIRIAALAAANLAGRDAARAGALLQQALDDADAAGLPATDAMHRALAIAANNIAGALEEKPGRSADERALMILAAQAARRHWAVAGTWLEVERAEYRLAMTWLQAGDTVQARRHAQQCRETVQAHDGPALEQFFACEALGVVERSAGNAIGHQQALALAEQAFAALDADDRGWAQPSLDRLREPPR